MNYITAEQFLSLPKEVQEVFIDWWEPRMHDLFLSQVGELGNMECCIEDNHTLEAVTKSKGIYKFPLFRLDQLWEFIEEVTEDKVYVTNYPHQFREVGLVEIGWNFSNTNLLQAMWDLAIKVAREWLKDE